MVRLVNNNLEGDDILIKGTMLELSGEPETYGGKPQIPQSGLIFQCGMSQR